MKVQNHTNLQPSFGNYKIFRETFQSLPKELRPIVEKEVNKCEPSLKNNTKSFNVEISVPPNREKFLELSIRKNSNGFAIEFPLVNLSEFNLKKNVESLLEAFKEVTKTGKQMSMSEFKDAVMLKQKELMQSTKG